MFASIAVTLSTAVSLALSGSTLPARSDLFHRTVRPLVFAGDSQRVADALNRAQRYAVTGRLADARREYRRVITSERQEGGYPAEPMWLLATSYFADGNEWDTALVLDELGQAAREVIDPNTELRARFEAAILWSNQRERGRASADAQRVLELLRSPAIAPDQRADLLSRMK
jgi:hypothetical protein